MADLSNPLLDDRDVSFLLYDVHGADRLCALPAFADHARDTFDLLLDSTRRLARDVLFPAYRAMDAEPPVLERGRVRVHPVMRSIYPRIAELGLLNATRPPEAGGLRLPQIIATAAMGYLLAGNLGAAGFAFLTTGAAHLIEAFGSESLKETYMTRMYGGTWTGTMALTEPQAGSSLADVKTTATPAEGGHYLLRGSKIFISGGDQDITENIVHLALARIEGAPPGIKGVSLFVVPRRRVEGDALVDNDVETAGLVHKIGWRGIPSVILSLGERGDCHGYLLGEPHKGIAYMFQMMNEARILVGLGGAATATVAYHEAVAYARVRTQGRSLTGRDPTQPQLSIIEHADVRRLLLRQKAIAEGALSLVLAAAKQADLATHADTPEGRRRAALLLDLLTPVAKSFPAEKGFESNALSVQVLGGYGYSSEYLPEAWLRDQKLNSIHEGTTGIQGLDLLGRKVVAAGGEALRIFAEEVASAVARARAAGVAEGMCTAMERAMATVATLTAELGALGLSGDVERMMLHSADYLELFSAVAVAWQWLVQAAAAREALARGAEASAFYEGKLCAAQYWIATELPKIDHLAALCRSAEDSYARMRPEWF
ncbi:Acyl-CoA dehydrogenase [Minicystis rosea]|nr:Acyl-CoA dehydrogenase [Minicystis rosea]